MNTNVQSIDIIGFFSSDIEELEKQKNRLKREEEEGKIHNLKEHDFGNGVSYVQYYDEENTRHTVIHKEQGRGHHSKIRFNGTLGGWEHEVKKNGAEIFTDPENGNNKLEISCTDKGLFFDTTELRGKEFHLYGGIDGKAENDVNFTIHENGEIEITKTGNNPKNKIFFKNGDNLQTVDENGKLIGVEEIDKQEILEASKGLAGVKENTHIESNISHLDRANKTPPSKTSRSI